MTKFLISNNHVNVFSDDAVIIKDELPLNTYKVKFDKRSNTVYLETTDSFKNPEKIYGNTKDYSQRIIQTFEDRGKNTGVLLNGEKGSGKTFLAKNVSYLMFQKGYPTLLINEAIPTNELADFIATIKQSCLIIFDEFEKLYYKNSNNDDQKDYSQQGLLTLLDGVVQTKHLFIFTCNEIYDVNEYFLNRPGRIYYNISFANLDEELVREYSNDYLNDKQYVEQLVSLSKSMGLFTFDILKTIIEEVNRYNKAPSDLIGCLNITPGHKNGVYALEVIPPKDIKIKSYSQTIICNPFSKFDIEVTAEIIDKSGEPSTEWLYLNSGNLESIHNNVFTYNTEGYKVILRKSNVVENQWRYVF